MAPQDKVSVFSGSGGGAPPMASPPRQAPMLFKRDGFLNDSFIFPGTKLEDAIRVQTSSSIHKHQKAHLNKYFKMLLSSIRIKWAKEPGPEPIALTKDHRRKPEPVKRKEQPSTKGLVNKQATPVSKKETTTKAIRKQLVNVGASLRSQAVHVGKKVEKGIAHLALTTKQVVQTVAKPAYQVFVKTMAVTEQGIKKGAELFQKVFLKTVIEPAQFLREKLTPPLEKITLFIVEKGQQVLEKVVQTVEKTVLRPLEKVVSIAAEKIEATFIRVEKEFARVTALVIAPLKEALETVQTTLTRVYAPFKKAKNRLLKKVPAIPKPNISTAFLERVANIAIRPFKTVLNTFIALPLAKTLQTIAEPLKQGFHSFTQHGGMAYAVFSHFIRVIGSSFAKRIERLLKLGMRFFLWLFKLIRKAIGQLIHFLQKFPKYVAKQARKTYLAIGRLTLLIASRFKS